LITDAFEDRAEFKANSPVEVAENIEIPVFLAHGKLDSRVHFDQYKRMKSALKKSSAKVTFMEFKDEDHFLSNQANRQQSSSGLINFLKK